MSIVYVREITLVKIQVSKMPKPAIWWGEKSEEAKQEFEKKIEEQKNKLRAIANAKVEKVN